MRHVYVRFINSGYGTDEGLSPVTFSDPFLYMGMPALMIDSPYGLGGKLRAVFSLQYGEVGEWVCDLD